MKTVKTAHPLTAKKVRLISGRCSPDYSYGIEDPHADIQKTGEAVLAIWNSRVDITLAHYNAARVGVLVRDESLKEFTFSKSISNITISPTTFGKKIKMGI